jgi:hypothetical protein
MDLKINLIEYLTLLFLNRLVLYVWIVFTVEIFNYIPKYMKSAWL